MTRRNIELILLCVAAPLVVLPFAMLALNDGQALTMNTLGVPLGIFVAFVLAHLSVRKFAPGADPAILPLAFALSGIGIAFVTRLAPDLAMRLRERQPHHQEGRWDRCPPWAKARHPARDTRQRRRQCAR